MDGIPDYPHGCDSGQDNATSFLKLGYFVEAPDLPAHLYLQMQTLADLATQLELCDEAVKWKNRADKLLEKFVEHSTIGNKFISKKSRTHEYNKSSQNIFNIMPLLTSKSA